MRPPNGGVAAGIQQLPATSQRIGLFFGKSMCIDVVKAV
jgi:hypothetical protein